MIIVLVVVLLLFGPKNLPKLAQSIGRSIRELKNGMNGLTEDIRDTLHNPPAASQAAPKTEEPPTPTTSEAQPVTPAPEKAKE